MEVTMSNIRNFAAAALLAPLAFAVTTGALSGHAAAREAGAIPWGSLAISGSNESVEKDFSLPKGFRNGTVAERDAKSLARYFAQHAEHAPGIRPTEPVTPFSPG
jgi:hypothetical protein